MAGRPDPKPARRPRPSERHRVPTRLVFPCWGCGGVSVVPRHHLIPKDFTKPGPDEPWNIISLCGTGTSGCHGAFHGNPWVDVDAGVRHTPESVRGAIARKLIRDSNRMDEIVAYLDDPLLLRRFFEGTLQHRLIEGGRWPDVHYYRLGEFISKETQRG